MNDLKALLKHEVIDLMSAEDQIIEAMPLMIKKATNAALKKALQEHLRVTEKQRTRLNKVQKFFKEDGKEPEQPKKGLLSNIFGGGQKCRGMEGLITEGQKVMAEDMSPEVLDAAIIACAQKIEHYEICGYGTARAYSRELKLTEATKLLEETLREEYEADDRLTKMALGSVNAKAETVGDLEEGKQTSSGSTKGSSNKSGGSKSSSGGAKKTAASKPAGKKTPPKKAVAKKAKK